jgi:Chromate transport protein ChrA
VCQAIPGATVAQLAAYVGLRLRGLGGALTAFTAFMLPAFLLITALSALYFRFQDLPRLLLAFDGLKILVVAIVLSASLDFISKYTMQRLDKLLALGAPWPSWPRSTRCPS